MNHVTPFPIVLINLDAILMMLAKIGYTRLSQNKGLIMV